jgi:hypothetical protein
MEAEENSDINVDEEGDNVEEEMDDNNVEERLSNFRVAEGKLCYIILFNNITMHFNILLYLQMMRTKNIL